MDFSLTLEQRAFQELAQQFTYNYLRPFAQEWDQKNIFPLETFKKAAELGFGGLFVSQNFGGCALKRLDGVIIFEELAQGCVASAAYISIHNMVLGLLDCYGTIKQKQAWFSKTIIMESLTSYCLTEPNSGSDAASLETSAVLQADHYIVNGTKCFISGGGVSDYYLCMVRTEDNSITALVIEKNTPGLRFGLEEKKMGWCSQPTTTVVFDQCKVPVSNRLGEEGQGFKIAMKGLDGGRLNIAACSLGGATFCLQQALDYVQQRKQFGKKLSDFQSIQFKLAEMSTNLLAARLMVYYAAQCLDEAHPDASMYCAMAKRFTTDICYQLVDTALQLHGGYGYIKDYQIERYLRDLRVHRILEGTNEIMNLIIARKVLNL